MKQVIFTIIFFLFVIGGSEAQKNVDKSRITLYRIYKTADFRREWFGPFQWYKGGEYYTKLEPSATVKQGMDIVKYNCKTGENAILISADKLIPEGEETPLWIEDYFWSHDLKKLMIFTNSRKVWRSNTRGDYWIYDMKKDKLFRLGKGLPESSLMFAKFSHDDTKVAYVSKNNIYMEDLRTGKIEQLTFDGTEDIINGTFDWVYEEEFKCRDGFRWSHDDKYIAFWQVDASDERDFYLINNTDSIYSFIIPVQYPKAGYDPAVVKTAIVEVKSKKVTWIPVPGDAQQNYIPRMQWLPGENKVLVRQVNRHQNTLKYWLYDLKSRSVANIYTDKDKAWIDVDWPDVAQTRWDPEDIIFYDHNRYFLHVSEKDGWRHVYSVRVADGKETLLTKGDYDIATLYGYDDSAKKIYFNASPFNATQRYLYSLDIAGGSLTKITPDTFSGVNLYDITPDFKYAIHSYSSLHHVPVKNLVSLPKHKVISKLVTNAGYEKALSELELGEREFFKVETPNGLNLDGYMIKPPHFDPAKKYPVLFYVYGEPAAQTTLDRPPSLWHLMLTQMGIVVITLDNRGTPALKGRKWRKSIYGKVGQVNIADQAAGAAEVLKWSFVDTSRVAVWGWSGGGSTTLHLLFKHPGMYKYGISVAPVTNLLYYDNIYEERYMGLPQENMQNYHDGSAINFAENLKGKLLLIHGTGDDNVHYQNTEALVNELIKYNKQFRLMAYPNRTHSIYRGKNTRYHLFTLMTDFFIENLIKK